MRTNSYLYGEAVEVPVVSKAMCEKRIKLLKINLEKQLDKPYMVRDNNKVKHIMEAISFWNALKNGENL